MIIVAMMMIMMIIVMIMMVEDMGEDTRRHPEEGEEMEISLGRRL